MNLRRKKQRKIKYNNKKYQFKIEAIRNDIQRLGQCANPPNNIELNKKTNCKIQGTY